MAQLMRTSNPALSSRRLPHRRSHIRREHDRLGHGQQDRPPAHLLRRHGGLDLEPLLRRAFAEEAMQAMMPALAIGGIGGFIVAMVTIFKKEWAGITAPIYALLEGLVLGGISAMLELRYHGIAIQAVSLTFGTLLVMLLAYRSGLIKVTDKLRLGIVAATGGIVVFYLLQFILGFFGVHFTAINGSGPIGIGFSLIVVVVAALNLVLDFDLIENGARAGRSQVHGVVRRLRADDHADLAVLRDPAAAVKVQQPGLNQD